MAETERGLPSLLRLALNNRFVCVLHVVSCISPCIINYDIWFLFVYISSRFPIYLSSMQQPRETINQVTKGNGFKNHIAYSVYDLLLLLVYSASCKIHRENEANARQTLKCYF